VASTVADARPPSPLFIDRGVELRADPHRHDASQTVGRMDGFRRLFVDPDAFAASLVPATAAGLAGDLHLSNSTSAWVIVEVNGAKAGQLSPFATAIVRDVAGGSYAVRFTLPNQLSWSDDVATRPVGE
jgi:hypothetical protein